MSDDSVEFGKITARAQRVKNILDERDEAYMKASEDAFALVEHTAQEALYALFDVPTEYVRWIDLVASETSMMFVCGITFRADSIPDVLLVLRPQLHVELQKMSADAVMEQIIKIGVPYELITASPETIYRFFIMMLDKYAEGASIDSLLGSSPPHLQQAEKPQNEEVQPSTSFDTSKLTPQQKMSLKYNSSNKESLN